MLLFDKPVELPPRDHLQKYLISSSHGCYFAGCIKCTLFVLFVNSFSGEMSIYAVFGRVRWLGTGGLVK